jgi:hypothetical protein
VLVIHACSFPRTVRPARLLLPGRRRRLVPERATPTQSTYTDTGLTNGTSYRYRVVNSDRHLRILIVNEKLDRLGLLATVVEGLGHEVIARSVSVREVVATTAREQSSRVSSGSVGSRKTS